MRKVKKELESIFMLHNEPDEKNDEAGKGLWNFDEKDEEAVS